MSEGSEAEIDGRRERAADLREQRRAQILASALKVFAERGYHGTSVSDLVLAAGVARGTFYLYFDSKHAVFAELLDELLSTLRKSVVGVRPEPTMPPVRDQLVGVVSRVLETALRNRALTRIIFREAVGLDAEIQRRLDAFTSELLGYLGAALELGHRIGMLAPVDVETTSVMVLGSVRQVVEHHVMEREAEVDVDRVAQAVVDATLFGLLTASDPSRRSLSGYQRC